MLGDLSVMPYFRNSWCSSIFYGLHFWKANRSKEEMPALERVAGLSSKRMYLSVAGGTATTFWAGVKLLDDAAEIWVDCTALQWVSRIHKLVAVVIHFHMAVRTNHLF